MKAKRLMGANRFSLLRIQQTAVALMVCIASLAIGAPETPPILPTWVGWEQNPLKMRTKKLADGAGPEANMGTIAAVRAQIWFFDSSAADFKGKQPGHHEIEWACNPRQPVHPKSLVGSMCEAALGMRVGSKKLVVPPQFYDGDVSRPIQVLEVSLVRVGPEASGPLTQADAEKIRNDNLSGQFSSCDRTWKLRGLQAEKDGLRLRWSPDGVIMLSGYLDAKDCPVPAGASFLRDPGNQSILSNSPAYHPGVAYDRTRIAGGLVRNPVGVTNDSAGGSSIDADKLISTLSDIAPLLEGWNLDSSTNASATCRADCETYNGEVWSQFNVCLAGCIMR